MSSKSKMKALVVNAPQGAFRQTEIARPEAAKGESASADQVAGAISFSIPKLASEPQSRWLVLAYDDLLSIEYMGSQLKPYWRRNGADAQSLLADSARDREKLLAACDEFDRDLLVGRDLAAKFGDDLAVDPHPAARDPFIGFAARAQPEFGHAFGEA